MQSLNEYIFLIFGRTGNFVSTCRTVQRRAILPHEGRRLSIGGAAHSGCVSGYGATHHSVFDVRVGREELLHTHQVVFVDRVKEVSSRVHAARAKHRRGSGRQGAPGPLHEGGLPPIVPAPTLRSWDPISYPRPPPARGYCTYPGLAVASRTSVCRILPTRFGSRGPRR